MPECQDVNTSKMMGQHAGIYTLKNAFPVGQHDGIFFSGGGSTSPEWWVNINRNGGSTCSGIYNIRV